MKLKDAVEKKFREKISEYPNQELIESLGEYFIEYACDDEGRDFLQVIFKDSMAYYRNEINARGFVCKDALAEMGIDNFIIICIKTVKAFIDIHNKNKIISLIKKTLNSISDQDLIKTYGIHTREPTIIFKEGWPEHGRGLFFSAGVYPVFWGHEMNTIKFINSIEYRKLFCNDVILSIMGHCENNGMGIC